MFNGLEILWLFYVVVVFLGGLIASLFAFENSKTAGLLLTISWFDGVFGFLYGVTMVTSDHQISQEITIAVYIALGLLPPIFCGLATTLLVDTNNRDKIFARQEEVNRIYNKHLEAFEAQKTSVPDEIAGLKYQLKIAEEKIEELTEVNTAPLELSA